MKEVLVGVSSNGTKWRTTGVDEGDAPRVLLELWAPNNMRVAFPLTPEAARQLSLGLYEASLAAEVKEEE